MSIEAQIADMAAVWPQFNLVERQDRAAMWRGALRPLFQTFQIQIVYRAPLIGERMETQEVQPRVSVLSPPLRERPGDPEGRLPHVYYGPANEITLCMLDPHAGDWSAADSLAHTTVPWTIEWLAAYEGWRATGEWTASGRHVEQSPPNV